MPDPRVCRACGAEFPVDYLARECAERDEARVVALPVVPVFEVAPVEPCGPCGYQLPVDHDCKGATAWQP